MRIRAPVRVAGRVVVCLALAAPILGAPVPLRGQAVEESRLLREAAALESRGDFEGAEQVLRRLLEHAPGSSGGLFALERVLRAKGETAAILPVVDTFLQEDPGSSGVRYLKLRLLAELDSLDAMEVEAERWFLLDPPAVGPYREVSRIYERSFGPERALEVLHRGRQASGQPSALAMEMGDLYAAAGDHGRAVTEWALAVGEDGAQSTAVARRVAGLSDGAEDAGRQLVGRLARAEEPGRRRAGALIALDLGLESEALDLVRTVADDMTGRTRVVFLTDVARRARDRELGSVAGWAYGALGENANSPAERRQFDQRIVEVSLATGDTADALAAQRRVVESFTPGSVDRRRATALLIRLEGTQASPARLRALLDDFRNEFQQAPELDDLASTIAATLLSRGDRDGATAVLEGIEGPRSSMQRGYLLLDAGEIEEGRRSLLMAIGGLSPSEATDVIQFAGLLGRVSPAGARLLAQGGVLAQQGRGGDAARTVSDGAGSLAEDERAMLLAEAARMADRGGAFDVAAEIRTGLLSEYPDAPEVAEATLSLARYRAETPGGREEAIRLLEDLVSQRPNAAVVPDARRELERLRGGT